jgi:hypothetical protein
VFKRANGTEDDDTNGLWDTRWIAKGEPIAPEGFEPVEVVMGGTDGAYVEITGGLSEGDLLAYKLPTSG